MCIARDYLESRSWERGIIFNGSGGTVLLIPPSLKPVYPAWFLREVLSAVSVSAETSSGVSILSTLSFRHHVVLYLYLLLNALSYQSVSQTSDPHDQ